MNPLFLVLVLVCLCKRAKLQTLAATAGPAVAAKVCSPAQELNFLVFDICL